MDAARPGGDVALRLDYEEAIVLFELLHRCENDGTLERLPLSDQAEQRVLWDLTAVLESVIDEAFDPTYLDVLNRARAAVRDSTE